MNNQNDHLKDDLKAWRDIEPGPGFEDAVWRRIEAAPIPQRTWLDVLALRPVFATAAGLAAGVIIGLALTTRPAPLANQFALFNSSSVAGNYVHLIAGDHP